MNTFLVLAGLLVVAIPGYLQRSKRAKNKVIRVVDNNCTGCRCCVKRCGHKVLEFMESESGRYVTVKYPEKCTACNNCIAVCKFNALELVDRNK